MRKRYAFIDLHRGWMLLLMIETHIFNEMLAPALKETAWFNLLNFINGWIAPSFIFISGFAFIIASRKKLDDFRQFGREFYRQLGRILLILLAGYSLHMPHLSFSKMASQWHTQPWQNFQIVDVLQCIAVGLLIMFLLRLAVKTETIFNRLLIGLTALVVMASPIIWKIDFAEYMPLFLANYFNRAHGSLFPLFPWLGFMFSGGIASYYFMNSLQKGKEQQFLRVVLYSSLLIIAISSAILYYPPSFMEVISAIRPNPYFFLLRLGIVLVILVGLRYYELWRKTERSVIMFAGRESLMVYWLHLQVLYRKFYDGQSISGIVASSLNGLEAAVATVIVCFLMILSAMFWSKMKRQFPALVRYAVIGAIAVSVIYFFMN